MAGLYGGVSFVVCISTTGRGPNISRVSSVAPFDNCQQLTVTIKQDLALSQTDIANSNIVALLAT